MNSIIKPPQFRVEFASSQNDIESAQRLRYDVFVSELGGSGDMVDHQLGLERDRYDPYFKHLLLIDDNNLDINNGVVGVYRLLDEQGAQKAGQFYSEDEYDLTLLRNSGRKILELGRSCLHPQYRGGEGMFVLWQALSEYIANNEIEILFGVASFHGTDIETLSQSLSVLHHRHLAPPDLRVHAIGKNAQSMNLIPRQQLNIPSAMIKIPSLIKAYIRLGGFIGQGAYIDNVFNTTDVCLIMDAMKLNERAKRLYTIGGVK